MRGLELDLADLAHGIWIEDHESAGAAASRIAGHPKVIPEQMVAIQASLSNEFPAFVQQDLGVHDAALEFTQVAESAAATEELFAIFLRIQQGCISCHSAFRARVSEALSGPGGTGH